MISNLITKLSALLSANTLLQKVYTYERANPEGTPFATITPSGNENEFATTAENDRVYAFLLRLYVERKGQTTEEETEAAMAELVDSVLDDLDSNWQLSGLPVPAGYTFIQMSAAPSRWGYVGRENEYRVAEVVVRCRVYVDITAIS